MLTKEQRATITRAVRALECSALAGRCIEADNLRALLAAPTPTVAADAAAPSEDAYVAQRMTETLAEVYATIIGDDAQPNDEALNAIERVKKAAQVLRLEVDLYRAQRDEAAAQPDERAAFEEKFAIPAGAYWNGERYAARDGYENSYVIERHGGRWEGWKASRATQPRPAAQDGAQ